MNGRVALTSLPFIVLATATAAAANGYLPPTLPNWQATYNMTLSSLTMQCNGTGWSSPQRGAEFGIVSYDWSNFKSGVDGWAAAQPMNSEERLFHQASLMKEESPSTKVFLYRNLVWAMPWFKSVREKLDDPSYAGFFLHFDKNKYAEWHKSHPHGESGISANDTAPFHVSPCAAENSHKCSIFYHDQNQSPGVPNIDPHPDGKCDPNKGCNCGSQPCGGYVWDHRNGSMLRNFLVDEFIGNALAHPTVDGFFLDDYWCSDQICRESNNTVAGCPCGDPAQGPTEIVKTSITDMGLSDADVKDVTLAWNVTMEAVQRKILKNDGYTWTLMEGQQNANAAPLLVSKTTCVEKLRSACPVASSTPSSFQTRANLFGVTLPGKNGTFPQLMQDVAFFLIARGPFAWIGYGTWGMTWPFNPEPAHGELPPQPHGLPKPLLLDHDFGEPLGICSETAAGSAIFQRHWSKAGTIELNCNDFTALLGSEMK